jgi:hypothetical protein
MEFSIAVYCSIVLFSKVAINKEKLLKKGFSLLFSFDKFAGVAELAYAPVSKTGSRKAVWVQVPPPAPLLRSKSDTEAALRNASG